MNTKFRVAMWLLTVLVFAGGSKRSHLSTSASVVIQPGVSFGPIRKSMAERQVIDAFGELDERNEGELKYFNLGFSVNMKNNVVHTISCFDPAGNEGPFRKAFE